VRRIVILGAGYAGVRAAQELIGVLDECEVWIVDRSRSHQILTEMYKVAAGGAAPERAQVPLRRLLPRHPHLHVLQGEIAQLEPAARCVRLASGRLAYDLALLGLGASPACEASGALRHAFSLQYLDSAVRLRRRLARLARAGGGRVVIVGGGLTGIELAGEIRTAFPQGLRVTIAQADPQLLPEEDPALADYAQETLQQGGVELRRGRRVVRVEPGRVVLEGDEEIAADICVWSGGVRANPLPAEAGLPVDGRGRVRVLPTLEVLGHPGLFAAGDLAAVPGPGGHTLPPTAQLAVQEGRQAARNMLRVLRGEEPLPLRARILGMAAPLGGAHGVARLGRLRLTGRPALAVHRFALLGYLYGIGGIGLIADELVHRPAPARRGRTVPLRG